MLRVVGTETTTLAQQTKDLENRFMGSGEIEKHVTVSWAGPNFVRPTHQLNFLSRHVIAQTSESVTPMNVKLHAILNWSSKFLKSLLMLTESNKGWICIWKCHS